MEANKIFQNFTLKLIWRRKGAYQRTFLDGRGDPSQDGEIVLADLKRFCNANKSSIRIDKTGKVDSHAMAVGEGRREVWDRINSYLHLDEKTVQNLTEQE